jgi:hypothetical protein
MITEAKMEVLFNRAVTSRHAGRLDDARAILEGALPLIGPEQTAFLTIAHGELGYINKRLGDLRKAELHYKCATMANPRSELASLGLFHVLVNQDRWKDALNELLRFVRGHHSAEYRALVSEAFCEGLPSPARELAFEARALLAAMAFEHVDVQWTVVCKLSAQSFFALAADRAKAAGWTVDAKFKNTRDVVLSASAPWPRETVGSATFRKSGASDNHSLFWSTYASSDLTNITGGLYVSQYIDPDCDFRRACERALDDLLVLFGSTDVLCVVLTLENDAIDLAPGIVGCYQRSLWDAIPKALDGLQQTTRDTWVHVRPEAGSDSRDDIRESLVEVQTILSAELWGD